MNMMLVRLCLTGLVIVAVALALAACGGHGGGY